METSRSLALKLEVNFLIKNGMHKYHCTAAAVEVREYFSISSPFIRAQLEIHCE